MLFWTIALGLGGLSLVTVTALSAGDDKAVYVDYVPMPPTATEPMPGNAASIGASDGILVRLQESPEPEDVNDNAGAALPALDVIESGP
jgi:hypothetical protein